MATLQKGDNFQKENARNGLTYSVCTRSPVHIYIDTYKKNIHGHTVLICHGETIPLFYNKHVYCLF